MNNNKTGRSSKIRSFILKRLKLAFLLFLIIPLVYYLLWNNQDPKTVDTAQHLDYLSYSVRSTNKAALRLVEKEQDIISWNINSGAYKNLEFVGNISCEDGIKFKADNLNSNDTLLFLGITIYHKNKLISFNGSKQNISVSNANLDVKNSVIQLVVEKSGTPVIIDIKTPADWNNNEPLHAKKVVIGLLFLFAFLLMIWINPSTKYLIVSLGVTIFVLLISYIVFNSSSGKITFSTSSKINNAEIFYSQTPFFSTTKRYSSEKLTDVFSQPLNLETEKYLRFDVGDSLLDLNQITVKLNTGIFSKSYTLSDLPEDRLILNDMVLIGKTYHITGNDPYIKLVSPSFIDTIDFLLFLELNKFLFIAIIVFIILLCLHSLLDKKLNRLKLKPAYLAFLLIPFTYYMISQHWFPNAVQQHSDYLYFSAKTTHPGIFTLFNGNDSLTSWLVDSPGYKYLQYKGHANINENFFIKVKGLSKQDTVSFLSINLFHDNQTYSLYEKSNATCKINNARFVDNTNASNVVVDKTGIPLTVSLMPSNIMQKNNQENHTHAILILIIFCVFIIALLFSPDQRFFIVSTIVTSILMVVFFWMSNEVQSLLVLKTSSPAGRVDIFYNNNPGFVPKQTYLDITSKYEFKLQIMPADFLFYRCDIGEKNDIIKDLGINSTIGILSNQWDYSTVSPDKILLNDMIRCGNDYRVCGDDPFIALSSAYQIKKLQGLVLIRQNLFFFLSLLLFLIVIIVGKYSKGDKLPNFFQVVFFLTFISTGIIIYLFNSENRVLLSENRRTTKFPVFQTDSTAAFIKGLDNYILDQLPGRKYMIRMNNLMQYTVFKQVVNSQIIHFGEDGWMYFIGGPAKDNYENRVPLTMDELGKIKNLLEARRDWLQKRDISFYVVFPPMCQSVYEEFVGQRMRRYCKKTKTEQLFEYLKSNSSLKVIDVYTPLMKAKTTFQEKLYFKNNCHWTYFGGYIAYCEMINYMKKDFTNIGEVVNSKDFGWEESANFRPDLLTLMDIDMFYSFQQTKPKFYENIITDTIYPFYLDLWTPKPPVSVITKKTTNPSMLMYGDSYAGCILPFLLQNYSKTTFVWTPLFQPAIIEKEKPDMVIQEMVDGSILNILLKNKPFPELKDSTNKLPPN